MQLDWLGEHRQIVGDFYRSANRYSQICNLAAFGEKIRFSPYEVQIMEHILEHGEENRNMKWYASQLGLNQATYSNYINRLVSKGLLDKYHAEGNQKDVILRVSEAGLEEYRKYAEFARGELFSELLEYLDSLNPEQLEAVRHTFEIWGRAHARTPSPPPVRKPVCLIKIK